MKLIISRKGFDAASGGCASPIFEDGSFFSLPIPEQSARVTFSDIGSNGRIGTVIEDLTRRRKNPLKANDHVHLDPDLRMASLPRKQGWRPLFGQAEAAQRHLDLQGVGVGDLFLFFGWFRQVEKRDGLFRFKPGEPDLHVLFGWLKVGDILRLPEDASRIPNWAKDHPHVSARYSRNTIYVAANTDKGYEAGIFRSAVGQLILTRNDTRKYFTRSRWCLPKWFHPSDGKSKLSYHSNLGRWAQDKNHAYLQTVGRGQEFVLDTNDYPQAVDWAHGLIANNAA